MKKLIVILSALLTLSSWGGIAMPWMRNSTIPVSGSAFPSAHLVSYWKLDESSGNATDQKGGNTLVNNNTVTYLPAKLNNGANFVRASSQYLSVANPVNLHLPTAFSITCWLQMATLPANGTTYAIASKTDGVNGYYLSFITAGGVTYLQGIIIAGGVQKQHLYSFAPAALTTYFVAWTWDGTTSKLSVTNSVQNTFSASTAISSETAAFQIGKDNAANYFNGWVDELAVFNTAIATTDITTIWNSSSGLTYP